MKNSGKFGFCILLYLSTSFYIQTHAQSAGCAGLLALAQDLYFNRISIDAYRFVDHQTLATQVLSQKLAITGREISAPWVFSRRGSFREIDPKEMISNGVLGELHRLTGDRFTIISFDTFRYLLREPTNEGFAPSENFVHEVLVHEKKSLDTQYKIETMTVKTEKQTSEDPNSGNEWISHFQVQKRFQELALTRGDSFTLVDAFGQTVILKKVNGYLWIQTTELTQDPRAYVNSIVASANDPNRRSFSPLLAEFEKWIKEGLIKDHSALETQQDLLTTMGPLAVSKEVADKMPPFSSPHDLRKKLTGANGLDQLKTFVKWLKSKGEEHAKLAEQMEQYLAEQLASFSNEGVAPLTYEFGTAAQSTMLGFRPNDIRPDAIYNLSLYVKNGQSFGPSILLQVIFEQKIIDSTNTSRLESYEVVNEYWAIPKDFSF